MQKIGLFVFLLLLSSCAFISPTMDDEINTVTIVKQTSYLKHHRAYFPRKDLKKIQGSKKYIYLYNKRTKNLGILLHYKKYYILHNMSHPKQAPIRVSTRYRKKYATVLNHFKKLGFRKIRSLSSIGYTDSSASKIFKGTKTLFVETRNYSHLQRVYKRAIRRYNAGSIKNIHEVLPRILIASYYKKYKRRAKRRVDLLALKTIAHKLRLKAPKVPALKIKKVKKKVETPKPIVKPVVAPVIVKKSHKPFNKERKATRKVLKKRKLLPKITKKAKRTKQEQVVKKVKRIKKVKREKEVKRIEKVNKIKPSKPYSHYLNNAQLIELTTYLEGSQSKNNLSAEQYKRLSHKKVLLQERRLFIHGSVEELIAAYKINKDPKYKQKIIELIKVKK